MCQASNCYQIPFDSLVTGTPPELTLFAKQEGATDVEQEGSIAVIFFDDSSSLIIDGDERTVIGEQMIELLSGREILI